MLKLQSYSAKPVDEKKKILSDINLTFRPGKIYAVMGPNGSGKSTLARTIMGDPTFTLVRGSKLTLNDKNIKSLSPDKRAKRGLFLSAQSPLEIPGVTVLSMLRIAMKDQKLRAIAIKKMIDEYAKDLHITPELLNRGLNEGMSGGERKKMEVLQMAVLNPDYIILDEIDTGVDVDALKVIAKFLKKYIKGTEKTLIMITHYNRILKYLVPDETIVIKNGAVAKKGTAALAKKIEKEGFSNI